MRFDAAGQFTEGVADVDPVAAPATVLQNHILIPRSGVIEDPSALHLVLIGTGVEAVTLDLYLLVEELGHKESISQYITTAGKWVRFAQGIVVTNGTATILTENLPAGGIVYARMTGTTITASQTRTLAVAWSKVKKKNKSLIKSLTFANDTGALSIFTVTGDVIVQVYCAGKVNLASAAAANVELGIAGVTDALIATTVATDIDADEVWHDAAPDSNIELKSVRKDFVILGGADIILTLSAQVDTGQIDFYCEWEPLSLDGNVSVA